MQIGVVGISYQQVTLDIREAIVSWWQTQSSFSDGSGVLLSTCHRVEFYFYAPNLEEMACQLCSFLSQWTRSSYTYISAACFNHLVRVAGGWDSLFLGESDIQRQVRDAYQQAASRSSLHPSIHYVFQKALKLSKELRTRYPIQIFPMGELLYQRAMAWAGDLSYRRILFIGFSRINRSIADIFLNKGVASMTYCNRTPLSKLQSNGLLWLSWDERHQWVDFDLVVVATSSRSYILHEFPTHAPMHSRLLIDLSVPRNIHPSLGDVPLTTLWNIDQLSSEYLPPNSLVLEHIEQKVVHYIDRFIQKNRLNLTIRPPTIIPISRK